MIVINKIIFIFSLSITLLSYQNCTAISPDDSSKGTSKLELNGNGNPYDGKPYVFKDSCEDGTVVDSRIVLRKDGNALLYRENCKTTTAKLINSNELFFSSEKMIYKSQSYDIEKPAIPLPGVISWNYQLTGLLNPQPTSLYIVDMFENNSATISSLKSLGNIVLCSISAGTFEDYRPDANLFAATDIGNSLPNSNGESWVDTRSTLIRSIMLKRLDLAKSKGCDGIDFDLVDGFSNNTGFPLTKESQLEYNQYLAFAAHDRNLILTLNNVPELAKDLSNVFDIAIVDQCFLYDECDLYKPFISKGKPVLAIEYTPFSQAQCDQAKIDLLSLIFLNPELDGSRYETCP